MKTTQTFSILIWANNSKVTLQGIPLYARITVNGKRAEISLKRKIDPKRWDANSGSAIGTNQESRTINNYIQEVKSELFRIYNQMESKEEFISAEAIKLRYTGQDIPQKTLLQVIDFHNKEMERKINNGVAPSTVTKFKTLEDKTTDFIKKHLKKSDLYLEQLDHRFITEFEYYLKSKQTLSSNTTMKYIRMLKKIMNDAVKKDWLAKNPFSNFKCTFKWPERQVLTMEELTKIMNKEFSIERLQQVKDYFVFSCYTGLAYIDTVQLTPDDVTKGLDGNLWISINRQKTGTLSRIPLLNPALDIIEKYKNHPKSVNSGTLFPTISNQKLNSYLKEIGDLCTIKKNLTFHLARHTFATTVTLSNGVPIESVSKMLGHTKITTTQIYAKVIEAKLSEDMDKLREKLSIPNRPKRTMGQ